MTKIQSIILEMFKVVAKICDENSIPYYAIGGTCIGAVRHKGFIPWDDDLDIGIPIDNYERFIEIAKAELPPYYAVFQPGDSKHCGSGFIKIMDKRTTLTERWFSKYPDSYEGVWLDVFPLSGFPSEKDEQEKLYRKMEWSLRFGYKMKMSFADQENISAKFLWILMRPAYWVLPKDYCWKNWLKLLKKNSFYTSEYVGCFWVLNKMRELTFPQELYSSTVTMDFEDTQIKCPIGWHKILSQIFGDYMKLPPADQRNSVHDFKGGIIDLDHSYLDYQTGKLKVNRNRQSLL